MKTLFLLISLVTLSFQAHSQIPLLNSRPTQTNEVIYLDFDGAFLTTTMWNAFDTIIALPSTLSPLNMYRIWQRVSEDFIAFDVNLTTDSNRFNQALPNKRMRVLITPSNAWFGDPQAGGVALLDSYSWGGNPGTPCFVFENVMLYSVKNITEGVSHEIGHTLSLNHQALWSANCDLISEYHTGIGSGSVSWAPIMGVGYVRNVTIWHKGTSSLDCNEIQGDHDTTFPGITSSNFLSFVNDDVGDTFNSGKLLNLNTTTTLDSGLISQPSDLDVFKFSLCNSRHLSIRAKPWALDTTNFTAANLDISLKLYDAASNLVASHLPLNQLKAQLSVDLAAGDYYFVVDGSGSNNYTDYGSLGRYYIDIQSDNLPTLVSSISIPTLVCPGELINFNGQSTGSASQWQWMMPGATPSVSNLQSSSLYFVSPGTYTISMQTKEGINASCTNTVTVSVKSFEECKMTGISQWLSKAEISIYPNPSKGFIHIESSMHFTLLEMTDVSGKVIYSERTEPKALLNLQLNDFSKGLYFIKLYTEQTLISTKKIILE